MRLLLINPRPSRAGLNLQAGGYFQPLALATIAGATPDDWEVIVEDENWAPASLRTDVDLVGITAFTASVPRAYELSAIYREAGIPTVLGGVHGTMRRQEAAEHFDSVVLGEADDVWADVITDAEFGIGGVRAFYQGGRVSSFALPNRSILHPKYRYGSIQIARGCPRNCSFCSVPEFSGHVIRRQKLEVTLADLFGIKNRGIFFVDDNLPGYSQADRIELLALLCEMAKAGFKKPWICQCSDNICEDRVLLDAMYAAGCRLLMIGFESFDSESLESVGKRNREHRHGMQQIHDAGLGVLGFFIMGFDSDSPDSMRQRVRAIHASGVDAWQLTVLTPLPGTQLFHEMYCEDRLLHTDFPQDWGYCDFADATFVPQGFGGVWQFRECLRECLEVAYDPCVLKEHAYATGRLLDAEAAVLAIAANEKYSRIARRRIADEVALL